MYQLCRSWLSCCRGAAAVELALVMPFLLLLLLAIFTYGVYFGAANSVQQITADAARASVAALTAAERDMLVRSHVAEARRHYALLKDGTLDIATAPMPGDPSRYHVEIRYDTAHLPIAALAGLFPLPAQVIERRAVVRVGGI